MILSETVTAPRGSEENFPAADIIIDKFRKLTARLPRERAERLEHLVLDLENLGDCSELAQALAF
jgi:hypothetical protein